MDKTTLAAGARRGGVLSRLGSRRGPAGADPARRPRADVQLRRRRRGRAAGGVPRRVNFQQRGLAPSVEDGPFTIEQALTDVVAVSSTTSAGTTHTSSATPGVVTWPSTSPWPCPTGCSACWRSTRWARSATGAWPTFDAEMFARTPQADRQRAQGPRRAVDAGRGDRGGCPRRAATGLAGLLRRPAERAADAAAAPVHARQPRCSRTSRRDCRRWRRGCRTSGCRSVS